MAYIDRTDEREERKDALKQPQRDLSINSNWAKIADQYLLSPIYGGNGRVLVKEDPYKSKYECSQCGGIGHTGEICKYCKGTGYDKGKEENGYCRDCTVGGGGTAVGKTLRHVPCSQCGGRGGTIITPEENEKNATTGIVLAISNRDILEIKVGEKVMFTSYSGSPFKFSGQDLRIIIERDLLGKVRQLKKNVDSLNESSFAELENTGVPKR